MRTMPSPLRNKPDLVQRLKNWVMLQHDLGEVNEDKNEVVDVD